MNKKLLIVNRYKSLNGRRGWAADVAGEIGVSTDYIYSVVRAWKARGDAWLQPTDKKHVTLAFTPSDEEEREITKLTAHTGMRRADIMRAAFSAYVPQKLAEIERGE